MKLKEDLIREFNKLHFADMGEVSDLNELEGSFVNLEYTLPSGQCVKLWDDHKLYWGNELCKKNSDRCYGIVGDEHYMMVCEYGENGEKAELLLFKRWN